MHSAFLFYQLFIHFIRLLFYEKVTFFDLQLLVFLMINSNIYVEQVAMKLTIAIRNTKYLYITMIKYKVRLIR
jgi:hypothetical protein